MNVIFLNLVGQWMCFACRALISCSESNNLWYNKVSFSYKPIDLYIGNCFEKVVEIPLSRGTYKVKFVSDGNKSVQNHLIILSNKDLVYYHET